MINIILNVDGKPVYNVFLFCYFSNNVFFSK